VNLVQWLFLLIMLVMFFPMLEITNSGTVFESFFSKRLRIMLIVWRITIVRAFFMPNYILQFYCQKRSGYVAEIATEFIVLSSIWWFCCHFPCEWFFFWMNNMKYSVLTMRSLVTSLIVQGSTHALCFKLFDIFS